MAAAVHQSSQFQPSPPHQRLRIILRKTSSVPAPSTSAPSTRRSSKRKVVGYAFEKVIAFPAAAAESPSEDDSVSQNKRARAHSPSPPPPPTPAPAGLSSSSDDVWDHLAHSSRGDYVWPHSSSSPSPELSHDEGDSVDEKHERFEANELDLVVDEKGEDDMDEDAPEVEEVAKEDAAEIEELMNELASIFSENVMTLTSIQSSVQDIISNAELACAAAAAAAATTSSAMGTPESSSGATAPGKPHEIQVCSECGRTFDSVRGMNIHFARTHTKKR
eukprot:TRINITY_DN8063_c0_g1_i1.p1 TRINITY_DN8063_c0_g1~~TRINITY_DN8063_c0_g1_i1.p1  ORF type:complete len:312 (+),score=75.50 TRINITY_DN8063_c0_g1_i1:110-937(+)